MHASFWFGIEQYSNRRQNVVSEKTGTRFARQTNQKTEPDLWSRFTVPTFLARVMDLRTYKMICCKPHDSFVYRQVLIAQSYTSDLFTTAA